MPTGVYIHKKGRHWKVKDTSKLREVLNRVRPYFKKGEHASIKTEFKKGEHPKTEWKKGQHVSIKTEFKKGHTLRLGKKWKVKDTSNYKHPKSEKHKIKMRKWHLKYPNRKFSNTKIEQKIAEELTKRGICFQQNKGLKNIANVDFFLPDFNIVIEADGCFYHNCLIHYPEYHKETRKADKRKTKKLIKEGFKVYRFWEHEINKSPEECIDRLKIKK